MQNIIRNTTLNASRGIDCCTPLALQFGVRCRHCDVKQFPKRTPFANCHLNVHTTQLLDFWIRFLILRAIKIVLLLFIVTHSLLTCN